MVGAPTDSPPVGFDVVRAPSAALARLPAAQLDQPVRPPRGRVLATRIGAGGGLDTRGFVLGVPAINFNPQAKGWRVGFDLRPGRETRCAN